MSNDEGDLVSSAEDAIAEGADAEDMEIEELFNPDNLDDPVSVFTYAMGKLVGSFTPWLAAVVDDNGVMHWFSNVRRKEKASIGLQLAINGFRLSKNGTCDDEWLRVFKAIMHSEHGRRVYHTHGAQPPNYTFKSTMNSIVNTMNTTHKTITWMFVYEESFMRHVFGSLISNRNYPIILLTRLALKFNDSKEPFILAKEIKTNTFNLAKAYREVVPAIETFLA